MPKRKEPSKDLRLHPNQQAAVVASRLGVPRPLVKRVLDAYRDYMVEQINEKDDLTFLELFRIVKRVRPATPERSGFSVLHQRVVTFKAKPASVRLQILVRRKLKLALRLTPGS
jgi:hypothetical protein